jgi:short-subunit dehydrogenase
MRISGNVFVVSGGGNGIGREVVLALQRRGARVAAVDLRADGLAETARLAGAGDRLSTHVVDITDRAAVEALPDAVVAAQGRVDGLLNVAGVIQQFVPFSELDYPEMERVVGVNFWGVVHTTKAFLPLLRERPEACVLNVSSMGGLAPVPGQTVYGASKAAVKLLTEGLYAELRGTGVAVTVVFPGGVATNIAGNSGVRAPGQPAGGPDASGDAGAAGAAAAKAAARLTTAPDAAAQIVRGVERGSYRVVIGRDATMLDRLARLSPRRATDTIATKMASLVST